MTYEEVIALPKEDDAFKRDWLDGYEQGKKDIASSNHMMARAYEVAVGDVISVSLATFINNSLLWKKSWQIQRFYEKRLTRRFLWWKKFPRLKKTVIVMLMYVGEDDNTEEELKC